MQSGEFPKYLTETQVSGMTGIALSTLRNHRFMRIGIPYSKLPKRSIRYALHDVVEYMETHRIDTGGVMADE